MISIFFVGTKKERTSVVAAGTIVADVKKPARIIFRNNIIMIIFLALSMKCSELERHRKRQTERKEQH
jgi:hypothetical protein